MPRKAAGTAAGRDGSTVGKVVVDGVTIGAGGEVRRRGHQPGVGGANTAGKDTPNQSATATGAGGERMFGHARAMGLEGIVSKRVDIRYKSGSCATARRTHTATAAAIPGSS